METHKIVKRNETKEQHEQTKGTPNKTIETSETEKTKWPPVGDILIENLQFEIEKTKVSNGRMG